MHPRFEEAIAELRDCLLAGEPVDVALCGVSTDYGLTENALRNRFEKAYGNVTTFVVRKLEEENLLAPQKEEAERKMRLAKANDVIYRHNASRPGHRDHLTDEQLQLAINVANSHGGRWGVKRIGVRRSRSEDERLWSLLDRLIKDLGR